jgi:mono/diheme cytochrome c family protein
MSQLISTPSGSRTARTGRWRLVLSGVLAGWISGAILLGAAAAAVVAFGLFDVRAITPHSYLMGWAEHTTMIHAVQHGARGTRVPAQFTAAQVASGFAIYETRCAACHGSPGISRAAWVSGLTPTPPYLLDAAQQWSPSELHFIVGNGVKMTAMPAWSLTLSDRDVWSVVAFLEKLPGLSRGQYLKMREGLSASHPQKQVARQP